MLLSGFATYCRGTAHSTLFLMIVFLWDAGSNAWMLQGTEDPLALTPQGCGHSEL